MLRWFLCCVVGCCLAGEAAAPSAPVAVAWVSDTQVAVACEDAQQVLVVDAASGTVTATWRLPGAATGVTSAGGGRVLATSGGLDGVALMLGTDPKGEARPIAIGHTPISPVCNAAGTRAWVCVRFGHEIAELDLAAGTVARRLAMGREPIAAAATADGSTLVVAHHLPAQPMTEEVVAATVAIVDLNAWTTTATVTLPSGSTGVRGVCLSPDGRHAYVTHVLARFQYPTTQLDRGWMNTNAVSVIDVAGRALVNTVLLDTPHRGAANPWGIACTGDGASLVVACAGTHEAVIIDRAALHRRLDDVAAGKKVTETSSKAEMVRNDLAFLHGINRRVALAPGNGPRGLAIRGAQAAVALHFSDGLAVVDLGGGTARQIALPTVPDSLVRTGDRLFNSAEHCFQGWQSCATCHPDARVDALNWDLLNDGMGNPKNTKNMLLATQTPPMMSLGIREDASHAVRAGFRFIQFHQVSEADAAATLAYLESLQPVASPRSRDPLAATGKAVFEARGCADCHPGPLFTDKKLHDVGTAAQPDGATKYDTPSLIEVWRTAPYLHDGSAASIRDVLTTANAKGRHGDLAGIPDAELEALIAYVESL